MKKLTALLGVVVAFTAFGACTSVETAPQGERVIVRERSSPDVIIHDDRQPDRVDVHVR